MSMSLRLVGEGGGLGGHSPLEVGVDSVPDVAVGERSCWRPEYPGWRRARSSASPQAEQADGGEVVALDLLEGGEGGLAVPGEWARRSRRRRSLETDSAMAGAEDVLGGR